MTEDANLLENDAVAETASTEAAVNEAAAPEDGDKEEISETESVEETEAKEEADEAGTEENETQTEDATNESPVAETTSEERKTPFLKAEDTCVHSVLRKVLSDMRKLIHFTEEEFIKLGNLVKTELEDPIAITN